MVDRRHKNPAELVRLLRLTGNRSELQLMVLLDQTRRDDNVGVVDRIDNLLDRNVVGHQPVRIYSDVEFTHLAAGYSDGCDTRQASELRTDVVGCNIAQTSKVACV